MGDQRNYYYVKWSAYAEINDERVDIARLRVGYQLDDIPYAEFSPVVGRDPANGKEAKALDTLLDAAPFSTVKIYIKGETEVDSPQGTDSPGFPYDEDVLVFDGYYQGVRYVSSRSPSGGSVTLVGTAANWLIGLVGTSLQNVSTTVKGAGGFNEVCSVGLDGSTNPNAMFNLTSVLAAGAEKSIPDLWQEFLKPLFVSITETPSVWGESDNDSAAAALERMDNASGFPADTAETELSFEQARGNIDPKIFGLWVAQHVAHVAYRRWRDGSIWEALRQMARDFKFRIVPLIDTATCAPIFGQLGGDPFIIIEPDEYTDLQADFRTPELITKVVVVSESTANPSTRSSEPRISAVVGIASSEEAWAGPSVPVRGQTVRVNAPAWLAAEPSIGELTRNSVGKNDPGIPDSVNPTAYVLTPSEDEDYSKIYNNYISSDTGDRFAKACLLDLMMRDRVCDIVGRFRLDVAPGSTVAATVIGGGKFMGGSSEEKFIYGLVERVTLYMNAGESGGSGQAHTALTLTNVRTGQEQTGYGGFLTEDEHPIYDKRFTGTKLWIDE